MLPLVRVKSLLTGRRLVSLPLSGPAGPLAEGPEIAEQLVETALAMLRPGESLELRCESEGPPPHPFVARHPAVVTWTPTRGTVDEIWLSLQKELRYNIRRAERLGVRVETSQEPAHLDDFCRLNLQTARRHGVPPQPRLFFDELWRRLAPRERIRLFLARTDDGEIVNAQLVIDDGRTASALYVGTDYRRIGLGIVKLTDWHCLRWAAERGFERFDWGLTHVSQEGLRAFKRWLGGLEQVFEYRYHPAPHRASALQRLFADRNRRGGRLVAAAMGQLPAWAFLWLGRVGYPHVG